MTTQSLSSSVTRAAARHANTPTSSLPDSRWWVSEPDDDPIPEETRELIDALRAEAGHERQRWAEQVFPLLERLAALEKKNQSRQLAIDDATLQEISNFHDDTLRVAFSAATLMEESCVLLGAMKRVQANSTARITRLEKRITLTSFWKRRLLNRELNRMRAAKSTVVDADMAVVQRERQRLEGAVGQLFVQADEFRVILRRRCGGTPQKWERQREEWIKVGMGNWQRAQNGLRLLPLPPLKATGINVRVEGIVQSYNALRRQGRITPVDGGPDVLVTRSSLQNATVLHPGQHVGFVIRQTDVGPWAQNVIVMRTT